MEEKIDNIFNYFKISDRIATGGQPTEKQLSLIKDAGYKTVINLALPTSDNALVNEIESVEALGMQYINIPIDFKRPTQEEFNLFCQVMEQNKKQPIFVHCAANLRISAFLYLYRQLYLNVSTEKAREDLEKLWIPNETWQQLIDLILEKKK